MEVKMSEGRRVLCWLGQLMAGCRYDNKGWISPIENAWAAWSRSTIRSSYNRRQICTFLTCFGFSNVYANVGQTVIYSKTDLTFSAYADAFMGPERTCVSLESLLGRQEAEHRSSARPNTSKKPEVVDAAVNPPPTTTAATITTKPDWQVISGK